MNASRSNEDVNESEWNDLGNWAGVGPFKCYFSKRDSRLLVPRYHHWFAPRTVNFGHRFGCVYRNSIVIAVVAILLYARMALS
jgi:uncharacterized membrane protein